MEEKESIKKYIITFTINDQILQFNFIIQFFLINDIDKKHQIVYRQRDPPFALEF